MSYLFKWQSISLASRLIAQFVGILQGAIILRLLSVSEWGTLQIVLSLTAIVGTAQSVGLTSGSTREISGAKSNSEAQKVFLVSLLIRLLISLPFVIFVFFYANSYASDFENSLLVSTAVKILALALLVDSISGIFNSVLSGFQQFKVLFIFQVIRAFISIVTFVSLVYFYDFIGYFYALVIFNSLNALILFFLAIRYFDHPFKSITFDDFKRVFRDIFAISIVIFAVKQLYSLWENLPNIYLKKSLGLPVEQIALFSLALIFCKKLMIFSDSITDVTLPVMSKLYSEDARKFRTSYIKSFNYTLALITFIASIVTFWSVEIVLIYSGKSEFIQSAYLVPFVMLGVWSYSKINLIKSSILVPSNSLLSLFSTYTTLLVSTYIYFYIFTQIFSNNLILLFSIAFGLGSFTAFLLAYLLVFFKLKINLINPLSLLYILVSAGYISQYYFYTDIITKVILTVLYGLVSVAFFYKLGVIGKLQEKFIKNK